MGEVSGQKARWLRRAEQREAWSDASERRADEIDASIPDYARDPAFMTQPGADMQRRRDKLTAREQMAWALREKAKAHRETAAQLRAMATRNKGDAEAARATRREKITAAIEPGAFVESIYGVRRVLKVNAKTLRLQGDGSNVTIDKALCTVVPECCGTCESWQAPTAPETEGGCWSPDRLDGDLTKGPAGYTLATSGCEAWMPRGLRHRYEWPRTALRLSQGETQAARLAREEEQGR